MIFELPCIDDKWSIRIFEEEPKNMIYDINISKSFIKYYALSKDLYEWFEENNIKYRIFWIKPKYNHEYLNEWGWRIEIFSNDDAVLFKLTWG